MTQITGNPAGGEEVAGADTDSLPPTQYLVLEVLAARARLGEACWTFPARLKPALNALQSLGLIWWRHAPIPDHVRAYLTDTGREAVLSPGYEPPLAAETGADDRLCRALADLEGYIDRRAAAMAGPVMKQALADAADAIAEARAETQRQEDLVTELRRGLEAKDRQIERLRREPAS